VEVCGQMERDGSGRLWRSVAGEEELAACAARLETTCSEAHAQDCDTCGYLSVFARKVAQEGLVRLRPTYEKAFACTGPAPKAARVRELIRSLPVVVMLLKTHVQAGSTGDEAWVCAKQSATGEGVLAATIAAMEDAARRGAQRSGSATLDRGRLGELESIARTEAERRLVRYAFCVGAGVETRHGARKLGVQNLAALKADVTARLRELQELTARVEESADAILAAEILAMGVDKGTRAALLRVAGVEASSSDSSSDNEEEDLEVGPKPRTQAPESASVCVGWEDGQVQAALKDGNLQWFAGGYVMRAAGTLEVTGLPPGTKPGDITALVGEMGGKRAISDVIIFAAGEYGLARGRLRATERPEDTVYVVPTLSGDGALFEATRSKTWRELFPSAKVLDLGEEAMRLASSRTLDVVWSESEELPPEEGEMAFLADEFFKIRGRPLTPSEIQTMIDRRVERMARRVRVHIAEEKVRRRVGARQLGTRVQLYATKYPKIGPWIEEITAAHGCGADAWRLHGDIVKGRQTEPGMKCTWEVVQDELASRMIDGDRPALGTVMELCVSRYGGRKHLERYRGLAGVRSQRMRKGFSLKINIDARWSRKHYQWLDVVQLKDGETVLTSGRDDAAPQKLNTVAANVQTKSLTTVANRHLTTRTDFADADGQRVQSVYCSNTLILETKTTAAHAICIVKSPLLQDKCQLQHGLEDAMLREQDELHQYYYRPDGRPKLVVCGRYDGGFDESLKSQENRLEHVLRHIELPSLAHVASTRAAGDSFLNVCENLNGNNKDFLANSFIPSTALGSNLDENNHVDPVKLTANMLEATRVYASRLSGATFAGLPVHVYQGVRDPDAKALRAFRKAYLAGNAEERSALAREDPSEAQRIADALTVDANHRQPSTGKYDVMWRCCFGSTCPHPLCAVDSPTREEDRALSTWWEGGPDLKLEFPQVKARAGGVCTVGDAACPTGNCRGHYMEFEDMCAAIADGAVMLPPEETCPSLVLEPAWRAARKAGCPTGMTSAADTAELASRLLVTVEEIMAWYRHRYACFRSRSAGGMKKNDHATPGKTGKPAKTAKTNKTAKTAKIPRPSARRGSVSSTSSTSTSVSAQQRKG
jgi:hypothetical protein